MKLLLTIVTAFPLVGCSTDQDNKLWDSLDEADFEAAEEAINAGADVNFSLMGRPILFHAIRNNRVANVAFLVKHGADVGARTEFGRTPLHEAALYGYLEVARLLIEAKADVNARNPRGETPLFYAEKGLAIGPAHTEAHDQVAQLLRKHGATY